MSPIGILCLALTVGGAAAQDPSWLEQQPPSLWPSERRDAGFRQMHRVYTSNTVPAGGKVHAFAAGTPLTTSLDVNTYMESQRASGLIIVQDNKIRLEKYARGFDERGRWTSMSIGKSVSSTLAGAAIKDGYIKSLDDKITTYIKELKGSAYEDVTIRHLLTMTSGMKWDETYTNPNSDNVRLRYEPVRPGSNATVSYLRRLTREVPPGTRWLYNSGDTELIGVLLTQATGKTLSAYLSEKIWKPYGMEQSAYWDLTPSGVERSGGGMSVTLRDYARFGQFILDGAKVAGGTSIVPPDWIAQATTKQTDMGVPGQGYGYLWWTNDDGTFAARGIFGQSVFIDGKRRLIIATTGNWPAPTDAPLSVARTAFWRTVQADIDARR